VRVADELNKIKLLVAAAIFVSIKDVPEPLTVLSIRSPALYTFVLPIGIFYKYKTISVCINIITQDLLLSWVIIYINI
jgi:hypothetical protein